MVTLRQIWVKTPEQAGEISAMNAIERRLLPLFTVVNATLGGKFGEPRLGNADLGDNVHLDLTAAVAHRSLRGASRLDAKSSLPSAVGLLEAITYP